MKQCPVCQSTIDGDSECPICGNTITYEPPIMTDKEQIPWNKHTVRYYLKNTWFSVLSCIFCIVFALTRPELGYLHFIGIVSALVSFFVSLFYRKLSKLMTWKYSEAYIPFKLGLLKYITGGIGILIFIVTGLIGNS